MPSPPSTRPSASRGRRSSAFAREDSGSSLVAVAMHSVRPPEAATSQGESRSGATRKLERPWATGSGDRPLWREWTRATLANPPQQILLRRTKRPRVGPPPHTRVRSSGQHHIWRPTPSRGFSQPGSRGESVADHVRQVPGTRRPGCRDQRDERCGRTAWEQPATPADRLPRPRPGGPMAAPLLQRIHAEIRARLREAEPAVQEYARLETALAALSGSPPPSHAAVEPAKPRLPQPPAAGGDPPRVAARPVRGRPVAPTGPRCCGCSRSVLV